MAKTLQNSMGDISNAYLKAAGHIRKMVDKPVDPDLAYYQSLKPEDFAPIEAKFGTEETRRYVMEMEARARKVRRVS